MSPFTKLMIRRVAREAWQCPDTGSPLPRSPLDPGALSLPLALSDQAQLRQWPGHHQIKLQKKRPLCWAHRQSWPLEVKIRSGLKLVCYHSLFAVLIDTTFVCILSLFLSFWRTACLTLLLSLYLTFVKDKSKCSTYICIFISCFIYCKKVGKSSPHI